MRYSGYERETTGHSVSTSLVETLLPGSPLCGDSNGPCSTPSSPKSGKRQFLLLKVDKYHARVQPRDPTYPR